MALRIDAWCNSSIVVSKTTDGGASPSASVASLAPYRRVRRCSSQAALQVLRVMAARKALNLQDDARNVEDLLPGNPFCSLRLSPRPGFHWRLAQWYSGGLWIRFSEVRFLQRLSWCYCVSVSAGACHASGPGSTPGNTVLERWPSGRWQRLAWELC